MLKSLKINILEHKSLKKWHFGVQISKEIRFYIVEFWQFCPNIQNFTFETLNQFRIFELEGSIEQNMISMTTKIAKISGVEIPWLFDL